MQCWSWADVLCYLAAATFLLFWHLSPLGVVLVLLKVPFFVLVQLPFGVIREFKITTFERRRANRPYSSFFEYAAISYIIWILGTFRAATCGPVFFGEMPARLLYFFRRCKYGTENIGDFGPTRATSSSSFNGYWLRSRSRMDREPDLVIYFVPGNLAGTASAYLYIEYLSMLLVELQVQGFSNPVVLIADIHWYGPGGYVSAFEQTYDGWKYLLRTHPKAVTLAKGSGIGGTLLLTMLLHLVRPFDALEPEPAAPANPRDLTGVADLPGENEDKALAENGVNSVLARSNNEGGSAGSATKAATAAEDIIACNVRIRKPDAMLLLSPFPVVWADRLSAQSEDLLGTRILQELGKQLVSPDQAYEVWARPGNVRDDDWWRAALPDHGTVVMYGSAELLRHDIAQLVQMLKSSGKLIYGTDAEDQLHAWPILLSFIARSVTDQMSGIDQVANHIAKMLVMECIC